MGVGFRRSPKVSRPSLLQAPVRRLPMRQCMRSNRPWDWIMASFSMIYDVWCGTLKNVQTRMCVPCRPSIISIVCSMARMYHMYRVSCVRQQLHHVRHMYHVYHRYQVQHTCHLSCACVALVCSICGIGVACIICSIIIYQRLFRFSMWYRVLITLRYCQHILYP